MKFLIWMALLASASANSSFLGTDVVSKKEIKVSFSEAKKGTVLVFVSAKCPCSAGHEQELKKLASEYSKKGFRFVGVHSNSDETIDVAQKHFSAASLGFDVIADSKNALANQYGALKTPHAYLISPSGEVLFNGGVDDSRSGADPKKFFLKMALDETLAGKQVSLKEAKTIGCRIARE